jgi:hypothetical protein
MILIFMNRGLHREPKTRGHIPEDFKDSEEVKDNEIKWIILGDDGQIYIVEEVRIKKSVWI